IPTIPGLAPHPNQAVESGRFADARRSDQGAAPSQPQPAAAAGPRKVSLMPDQTRDALKRLAETMRRAAGTDAPAGAPAAPKAKPNPTAPTAERRADVPGARERARP